MRAERRSSATVRRDNRCCQKGKQGNRVDDVCIYLRQCLPCVFGKDCYNKSCDGYRYRNGGRCNGSKMPPEGSFVSSTRFRDYKLKSTGKHADCGKNADPDEYALGVPRVVAIPSPRWPLHELLVPEWEGKVRKIHGRDDDRQGRE